jgi:hypothetical protein
MTEEQLQALYSSIAVADDAEHRVRAAALIAPSRPHRTGAMLSAVLASVVVVVAAVLFAVTRSGDAHRPPTGGRPTSATSNSAAPEIPQRRANAISGAVLENGQAVVGARVTVIIWPNSSIQSGLKVGAAVPTKVIGSAQTDEHGGFVLAVRRSVLVPRYLEGNFINVEIDVNAPSGKRTEWNVPISVSAHDRTAPTEAVFDFGRHTIVVNGERSKLPVF